MRHKDIPILLVILTCLLASCGEGGGSGENPNKTLTEESNLAPIQFGPTAIYSFDEIDGHIAYNSEFDAFHGEIVGASRVAGKVGSALDFSNTDGAHVLFDICCHEDPDTGDGGMWVSFPDNRFTIAAWLKPTAMAKDTIYPIFGGFYGAVQSMKLRVNNGSVDLLLYPENNGTPITIITSVSTIDNEEWTHVAVIYDGSQAVIYFNGIEDNYSDTIMPVEDITNDYYIGGIPTSHSAGLGEHSFPGAVDEFILSQNILSPSEIAELAAAEN